MKLKLILLFLLLCTPTIIFAQSKTNQAKPIQSKPATTEIPSKEHFNIEKIDSILTKIDTLIQVNNMWLEQIEMDYSLKERYKLYQTENLYTLLQLDTKTGKIEQVQWSLESDQEGTFTINGEDLTYGYGSGCFELYPTKNMYQFILINKTNGRKWHVQWGTGGEKSRWIRRIY
jgi:hypothetical protein